MEYNEQLKVLQQTQNLYPALIESKANDKDAVAFYTTTQELAMIISVEYLEGGELVALFFKNVEDYTAYKYRQQKATDIISCIGIEFSAKEDIDIVKGIQLYANTSVPAIKKYIMNQGISDECNHAEIEEMTTYLAYFADNKSLSSVTKAFEKSITFRETGKDKIASVKWSDKTNRFITSKATDIKEPVQVEETVPCEFKTNYSKGVATQEESMDMWSRDPFKDCHATKEPTKEELAILDEYITEEIIQKIMNNQTVTAIENAIYEAKTEEEQEKNTFLLRDEFVRQFTDILPENMDRGIIYSLAKQFSNGIYIDLLELKLQSEISAVFGNQTPMNTDTLTHNSIKETKKSRVKPHRAQQPAMKKKKKKGKKRK